MQDIIIGIAVSSLVVLLWLRLNRLPSVFAYVIREDSIDVRLFNWIRVIRVPLHEIESASIESWSELLFDGTLANGLYLGVRASPHLLALRRRGKRAILIAPDNRDEFAVQINARLNEKARVLPDQVPNATLREMPIDPTSKTRLENRKRE